MCLGIIFSHGKSGNSSWRQSIFVLCGLLTDAMAVRSSVRHGSSQQAEVYIHSQPKFKSNQGTFKHGILTEESSTSMYKTRMVFFVKYSDFDCYQIEKKLVEKTYMIQQH